VIENMSYYVCPHCGERDDIFGTGGGREAADTLSVPLMAQVPLIPALREGGDVGRPLVLTDPDAPASIALRDAGREVAKATKSKVRKPLTLMTQAPAHSH
jgi:ATP-binding protein involved in chromosome partitioning